MKTCIILVSEQEIEKYNVLCTYYLNYKEQDDTFYYGIEVDVNECVGQERYELSLWPDSQDHISNEDAYLILSDSDGTDFSQAYLVPTNECNNTKEILNDIRVGCQTDLTKDAMLERIKTYDGGITSKTYREVYIDIINKY